MKSGFVYVISYKGFCKVGFSECPDQRINCLTKNTGISGHKTFISNYKEDAFAFESIIHTRLMDKNIGGEWFKSELVDVVNVITDVETNGYDEIEIGITKKPRVPVTPSALEMLEFICENTDRDLYFLDNKSKVLTDIISKEFLAAKDLIKKVNK